MWQRLSDATMWNIVISVLAVRNPKEKLQSGKIDFFGQIHFYKKDIGCMLRCNNIDDNCSNGAVTQITDTMNGIQLCSAMNLDFVWGPTMDDKGSEDVGVNDVLCSIVRDVMLPAL
ncbi:hypothetical protein BDFB_012500, partial [Asbolus verrucosus]